MAVKSFNVDEEVYSKFSKHCKDRGMSMSKQVEFFMRSIVEEEPELRQEYIEKIERICKGKFIKVNNFSEEFGLNDL
ncbi:antitoxin component of RelBE/YafQ-DinJ toxin-antitoxin module [Methanococcus maripaludis]|uniref:Antitoxin component of RelBE/YafQ-DinJ toxin-antitoxin module n=2 Tax=Methanococcus maripaludis TaxID=39152 RepID=A0A2L1CAA3_METMI|nr:hypothetical protein [Methanococcus maripaludis]AVB76302.1 hypothetical protein MMJJ_08920 [Methanococcus maripaludis]MBA2841296.1 antitoxin component of RelBE/YafQ-DinJ toxin-antitoxin module [Methanococcus maripaludis]MBA2864721.1 antitoxin component of RelBE/YafQ-DinJ toxin-antitoxin module [Methanococcus maripaludis]MBA2869440.1 antitoxin component of RelBE/YafQ-DinJ toxin-antitoxin module [Methanococcus maripaludis]MBB6401934.1 antitoxin component of RelBE/YafQ-DinJ toxin-antitoxin mod